MNNSGRNETEFFMIFDQLTEEQKNEVIRKMQELLAMQAEIT